MQKTRKKSTGKISRNGLGKFLIINLKSSKISKLLIIFDWLFLENYLSQRVEFDSKLKPIL